MRWFETKVRMGVSARFQARQLLTTASEHAGRATSAQGAVQQRGAHPSVASSSPWLRRPSGRRPAGARQVDAEPSWPLSGAGGAALAAACAAKPALRSHMHAYASLRRSKPSATSVRQQRGPRGTPCYSQRALSRLVQASPALAAPPLSADHPPPPAGRYHGPEACGRCAF